MGFVKTYQTTAGIHTRLYSRAFVIEAASAAKNDGRVVYATVDVCFISQLVRKRVIEALQLKYGDTYR